MDGLRALHDRRRLPGPRHLQRDRHRDAQVPVVPVRIQRQRDHRQGWLAHAGATGRLMSENIWIALLAMFGGTILGPAIQRLFSRRNDHAKADVDEAAADASAAAEWQKLYNELKVEVELLPLSRCRCVGRSLVH